MLLLHWVGKLDKKLSSLLSCFFYKIVFVILCFEKFLSAKIIPSYKISIELRLFALFIKMWRVLFSFMSAILHARAVIAEQLYFLYSFVLQGGRLIVFSILFISLYKRDVVITFLRLYFLHNCHKILLFFC